MRKATAGKGTFSTVGSPREADAPEEGAPEAAAPFGVARVPSKEGGSDSDDGAKRQLAAQLKSSLSQAEARVTQAEAELKAAEDHWSFVNSHSNSTFALNEARSRLASAKAAVERARQQQRDEIEDRARRASIPPGWIR